MSSVLESGKCSDEKLSRKCSSSKEGEHKYVTIMGSWPSELKECIHCKDQYYTK